MRVWFGFMVLAVLVGTCGTVEDAPSTETGRAAASGSPFNCDDQPVGWPSTEQEIRDAFASPQFAVRQCAWERLRDRVCQNCPRDLEAILANLVNDPDAEVRLRARTLLEAFVSPENVDTEIVPVPLIDGGGQKVTASADNVRVCHLWVYEVFNGQPAEPILFRTLYPQGNRDACGHGTIDFEESVDCNSDELLAVLECDAACGFGDDEDTGICFGPSVTPTPPEPVEDPFEPEPAPTDIEKQN